MVGPHPTLSRRLALFSCRPVALGLLAFALLGVAGCRDDAASSGGEGGASVERTFAVGGMVCGSCEEAIQTKIGQMRGVAAVSASHEEGVVVVRHDPAVVSAAQLTAAIEKLGYRVRPPAPPDDGPSPGE